MALATEPNCLKCGQGRGSVPPPSIVPDREQTDDGIYLLGTYPDCTDPYVGDHIDQQVYVVGFRTEHERLYSRARKGEMVTYYNSFDPPIPLWHDYAARFCNAAMTDLLGS